MKYRSLLLLLVFLQIPQHSPAISKGWFTKGLTTIGGIVGFYYGKKLADANRNWRIDRYYMCKDTSYDTEEHFYMALISATGVLVGCGIGYLAWYFSPDGRLQQAKNLINYSPNQTILTVIEKNNSADFREYIKRKNNNYPIPLVTEFYWYTDSIDYLKKAQDLLHAVQNSPLSRKNLNAEAAALLPLIPAKIELLQKGIAMLKEDPTWFEMLNAYNIEESRNIQNQLLAEARWANVINSLNNCNRQLMFMHC